MKKRRYLIGNLKMNPGSLPEVSRYLSSFRNGMTDMVGVETVIAAPSVYLERFSRELPAGIGLAAQDVFWEREGSYTGQISVGMLRDLGVRYVIVGHSERRSYAHETDKEIGMKVRASLSGDLRPILCVGETAEERDGGLAGEAVSNQVLSALRDVSTDSAGKMIVAYEPRWAIGGSVTPESGEIAESGNVIRLALERLFGPEVAGTVPVLYGGSVKGDFLDKVCLSSGMDGVLVGRGSLDTDEMAVMAGILSEHDGGVEENTSV